MSLLSRYFLAYVLSLLLAFQPLALQAQAFAFRADDDVNLKGAIVSGESVTLDVGNDATVFASSIEAGTENNIADITIATENDLIIASGMSQSDLLSIRTIKSRD